MIRVNIVMKNKDLESKDNVYETFDCKDEYFDSISEAMDWLQEKYSEDFWEKKEDVYRYTQDGLYHVGYVIDFKNADMSHLPIVEWKQRDWITFYKDYLINLEEE